MAATKIGFQILFLLKFREVERSPTIVQFTIYLKKKKKNAEFSIGVSSTHHFHEEALGDGPHRPPDLDAHPMARFVLAQPVAALVLRVKPLQPRPSEKWRGARWVKDNDTIKLADF